jgi:hypothetical protein
MATHEEQRTLPDICACCRTPIVGAGIVDNTSDGTQFLPVMNAHLRCFQDVTDEIGQPNENEVPEGARANDVWVRRVWDTIQAGPK